MADDRLGEQNIAQAERVFPEPLHGGDAGQGRVRGFGGLVLGGALVDALATPLWKWNRSLTLQTKQAIPAPGGVQFVDVAHEAGLNIPNVWGAADRKKYILEAKGSGLAFFDYDHDGWLDIYLTNGTRFNEKWPEGKAPTSQLFKNRSPLVCSVVLLIADALDRHKTTSLQLRQFAFDGTHSRPNVSYNLRSVKAALGMAENESEDALLYL